MIRPITPPSDGTVVAISPVRGVSIIATNVARPGRQLRGTPRTRGGYDHAPIM
jgi:hypothetical protein